MRETVFIKNNIEKWKSCERTLKAGNPISPDAISEMYIQITEDLSYARTFYEKSNLTVYLNNLAIQVHQLIYRNKKERRERFKTFWLKELPQLFYDSRKEISLSLIIFSAAILIGIVSSANDDMFVRLILGDNYVNMTEANINKEDPMAVYKQANETNMFFGITFNNLRVSFFAFACGALFGLGTAYILIFNGVMLGAFQFFFYQKGLLWTSFLTIWIHGTLEISTIVIEGAAGFVIARALLFPNSFSRIDALKIQAKKGIKIVIGVSPIIIIAGFLEGFVTRHTEFPAFIKLFIIIMSALFVIYYYWLYPIQVNREKGTHGNQN